MLSINISELIWTIINFFLLYFLLKHFLFDPIIRFTDARKQRLADALEKEKAAQAEVETNNERIEDEKASRRAQAKALIEEAGRADAKRSAATLAAARRGAELMVQNAGERVESERAQDKAALEAETDKLADILAQNILGKGEPV